MRIQFFSHLLLYHPPCYNLTNMVFVSIEVKEGYNFNEQTERKRALYDYY